MTWLRHADVAQLVEVSVTAAIHRADVRVIVTQLLHTDVTWLHYSTVAAAIHCKREGDGNIASTHRCGMASLRNRHRGNPLCADMRAIVTWLL